MSNGQKSNKDLHKDHRSRMRDKYDKNGFASFAEHEILEMLLFYTIPRANTNPTAHRLIERFGNLARVLDAPRSELTKIEGMGESSAMFLEMLRSVANLYINSSKDTTRKLNTVDDAGRYLVDKYVGITTERVYFICLDDKNNIVKECFIGDGAVGSVEIDTKRILTEALNCNCTTAILAHNHPTGVCKPSVADIRATDEVRKALIYAKVTLVSHIVVAEGKYCEVKNLFEI